MQFLHPINYTRIDYKGVQYNEDNKGCNTASYAKFDLEQIHAVFRRFFFSVPTLDNPYECRCTS